MSTKRTDEVPAPPGSQRAPAQATILHLSDLHFGMQFVKDKWDEVLHIAKSVRPDLVVVTGDLVESPWRWRLKTAKNRVAALRDALRTSTGKADLQLVCVPGNHDTRIQGVFPVPWLLPLCALCLLAAALVASHIAAVRLQWPLTQSAISLPRGLASWIGDALLLLLVTIAIAAMVVRACVTTRLSAAVGDDVMISSPKVMRDIGIGVVPFDSASRGLSWARGRVFRKDMVACKTAMETAAQEDRGRDPFWIALVHHHPLPLPYDDQFEQMMVMDNAGAFLSELSARRIRLVLHGHKHHQHFARITVDPATSERVEVSVLSAGTPTRGRTSMVHRHGFNVIRVGADHRVRIEMFEAEGDGTFSAKTPFDMVPSEEHARLRFEYEKGRLKLLCRRMVCGAEINSYGDAQFVREFRGVSTSRPLVKQLDGTFQAQSESGFVEAFRAQSLSSHGPGVAVKTEREGINQIEATLLFKSSGLQSEHDPIDFLIEHQSNNAFALDRWQFSQMYVDRRDFTEDVQFVMTGDIAVEELVMHVHFSTGAEISLPTRIDLRWRSRDDPDGNAWYPLPTNMIVRMERQSVIQVRIPYPKPNSIYQINWDLDEDDATPVAEAGAATALRLRRQLTNLLNSAVPKELMEMVATAEQFFREELPDGSSAPFDATLFVYHEPDQTLRALVSTLPPGDDRVHAAFKFGLGIAGRSFKSSSTVNFVKPHNETRAQPTGYILGNGKVAETPADIREEAIIAFALAPLDASDWPYAVLQISSDTPGTSLTLAALRGDQGLEIHARGLRQSFTAVLPDILSPALSALDG
jgi:hypothetical protein